MLHQQIHAHAHTHTHTHTHHQIRHGIEGKEWIIHLHCCAYYIIRKYGTANSDSVDQGLRIFIFILEGENERKMSVGLSKRHFYCILSVVGSSSRMHPTLSRIGMVDQYKLFP